MFLQRDVHDNEAFYTWAAANNRDFCCNDVSLRVGSRAIFFLDNFDLGGGLILTGNSTATSTATKLET